MTRIIPIRLFKIVFLFILFLLPTQFGKHFWPDFSYLLNIRIDYLSPTIYLTDILILFLSAVGVFLFRPKINLVFLLSLLWLFAVSIFSLNPQVSLLGFLRILLLLGFVLTVSSAPEVFKSEKTFLLVFSFSVIVVSLLALWQYFLQSSVGGGWWFLGERFFNAATPFIAQAEIFGKIIIRPYSTFSHPNVLAGYLCIILTILLFRLHLFSTIPEKIFSGTAIFLGVAALSLTLSRTALLSFIFALAVFFLKNKKTRRWVLVLFLIFLFYAGGSFTERFLSLSGVDKKSFEIRQELNGRALKIFLSRPFFGVGLNNYLIALPRAPQGLRAQTIQPAHNIYLLILCESGIVGLGLFLLLIAKTINILLKRQKTVIFLCLLQILFIGFWDHYFYTLQQGQLLFGLILGLAWSKQGHYFEI